MARREAARRVGRDVKGGHGDIHAVFDAGILDRTTEGQVVFPCDAVSVAFTLGARLNEGSALRMARHQRHGRSSAGRGSGGPPG
jgi:predicted transcriptional regulator